MTKSDTRLQIEHDHYLDRMNITISMPSARWQSAARICRNNFGEVPIKIDPQGKLVDLFMNFAILFMDGEATQTAPDGSRTWQWGFCDGNGSRVRQAKVEVIDRPLQPLNEPETDAKVKK